MAKPEVVTFLIGVLAAIALLRNVPKVSGIFRWLLLAGIAAQIVAQTVQFTLAEASAAKQRASEREYAAFLYILLQDDPALTDRHLSKNLYALAYRDFRSGRYAKAKQEFTQLIGEGRFRAQSYYLLARMSQLEQEHAQQPDYSEARGYLENAVSADDKYEAPFYLRAILEVAASETGAGLKDLETATRLGTASCADVNNPEEVQKVWARVATDVRFQAIQKNCKALHHL